MHIFIVEVQRGKLVPVDSSKQKLFDKIIHHYQEKSESFKITIENISKKINVEQQKLYNAFIIKASEHFGVSFKEMEKMLIRHFPLDTDGNLLSVSQWTSADLDRFINLSTALLSEHGFNF